MKLPRLIYEVYPVLYISGGIAVIILYDSLMSFASGMMLGVAGILILFMRRNYRATRNQFIQSH